MQDLPRNITVIHSILLATLGLAYERVGGEEILDIKRLQAGTRTSDHIKKAVQRLSPVIPIRKSETDQYLMLLRDRSVARKLEKNFSGNLDKMLETDPAAITNPITLLNCPLRVFDQQFPDREAAIAAFINPGLVAFRLALLVFADINGLILEFRDLDQLHAMLLEPKREKFRGYILDGLNLLTPGLGAESAELAYQSLASSMEESRYLIFPQKTGI